jgi:hypothetical protein
METNNWSCVRVVTDPVTGLRTRTTSKVVDGVRVYRDEQLRQDGAGEWCQELVRYWTTDPTITSSDVAGALRAPIPADHA